MNRLADSASPYLRQHADNPVDWWPWSDAAFEEAARRDVPVFLSIGYATCHWCHVMAHESFEDAEAAAALNAAFVCVKVDREERPDVDGIYMEACLALNGHGGWPLTALLTPEREPFYVATYLPKTQRGRRIGVLELCASATEHWREDARGVRRSADEIATHLRSLAAEAPAGDALGADDLRAGAEALRTRFDGVAPGFGAQPKFPTPHHAVFLLREAHATGDASLADMAVETLRAIRRGGIYDHAGGGLHRYATDRRWLLPHFEKMLTDQALYALACAEAVAAGLAPDLAEAARGTLGYALRDLRRPDGLFGSAEDADSPVPGDLDAHAEEGAYYLWTEAELDDALGPADGALARVIFGTTAEGTYVEEATGQRTGQNVLHRPAPLADLAATLGRSEADTDALAADLAERLRLAREARPRPLFDDKPLADGNGLVLAALAVAARTLGDADLERAATDTAEAVLAAFVRADGRLLHRPPAGSDAGIDGLLDDAAFLTWGLLELHQTTLDPRWLEHALRLHAQARERFEAPDGGFFVSPADAPDLLVRQRDWSDTAIPSGHSVAVLNGLRLGRLTGDRDLEASALAGLRVPEVVRRHPAGSTLLLAAARFALGSAEVVVAGEPEAADTRAMLDALRSVYAPQAVFARRSDALARLAPFTAEQRPLGAEATAYVCQAQTCAAPTANPAEAARLLAGLSGP